MIFAFDKPGWDINVENVNVKTQIGHNFGRIEQGY